MNNDHRLKQVTLPGLSFKDIQIVYVKILSKMTRSERVSEQDDKRQPATVVKVLNLQDNLEYRLICPSLMVSSFNDEGDEYVDKCYEVVVSSKPLPGKRYKKNVEVYEIDGTKDYKDYPNTLTEKGAKK